MFNLVIGGHGFIGRRLVQELTKNSETGLVVDIGIWDQQIPNLDHTNFESMKTKNLNWSSDCLSRVSKEEEIRIWHLAANSDIAKASRDSQIDFELTLGSTIQVLKIASQIQCKSIQFTSSSAIYGERILGAKFIETDTFNPISSYGTMKLASEQMIKIFCDKHEIPYNIFRLANIVGPNMTHGLIFDLVNKLKQDKNVLQILGDGNQRKTYMHVDDLINVMFRIASKNRSIVVNVGPNDEGIKVSQIAELLTEKFDHKIELIYEKKKQGWHGDVTDSVMDTTLLNTLASFSLLSSQESVSQAIESRLKEIF